MEMEEFSASHFFNLQGAEHARLFQTERVWDILHQLEVYLHSLELGRIEGDVSPAAYLINPELISIGEGSAVEPGAYIKGPCVIGRNTTVRHGAYIRGGALIGDDCVVGHATEIKHSILLSGAQAAHFAYVGDSIIGRNVNLGAGVRCANLRLDGEPICLFSDEGVVETGMRKLGAIIGDGSALGCNCVTNPGTLIPPDSRFYPGTIVSRRLLAGSAL